MYGFYDWRNNQFPVRRSVQVRLSPVSNTPLIVPDMSILVTWITILCLILTHYVDFVEEPLDLLGPPGLPSWRSKSDALDFRSPSGELTARVSSDEADIAFTCAITTCAFKASSSSSRIRCCLMAARFSASRARFSAAVRARFGDCGAESFAESLLEWCVLSNAASSGVLCAWSEPVTALFIP